MRKYGLAASALVFGATLSLVVSTTLKAQSPWESGGYKGYDPQTTTPDTPSGDGGGGGLQGFTLFPDRAAPTAPTLEPTPTPAPTLEPQSQGSFLSTTTPPPTTPKPVPATSADNTAQIKAMMAQVADSTFALMAKQGVDTLLQASQLAQKNATSDMQPFVDQINSIYGGMQKDLTGLLQKNNIPVPAGINIPNGLDQLKDKNGADFNKQYTRLLMQQFSMLASAFKGEAENGQTAALKSYAASHLDMVNQQKATMMKSYMSSIGQGAGPPGMSSR